MARVRLTVTKVKVEYKFLTAYAEIPEALNKTQANRISLIIVWMQKCVPSAKEKVSISVFCIVPSPNMMTQQARKEIHDVSIVHLLIYASSLCTIPRHASMHQQNETVGVVDAASENLVKALWWCNFRGSKRIR